MMKSLLFLSLLVLGTHADLQQRIQVFEHPEYCGTGKIYTSGNADLKNEGLDNMISSVEVTGIWILYGEANFGHGEVYLAHGINKKIKIPHYINDKISSLRYAGDQLNFNTDSVVLYKDSFLRGQDYYIKEDLNCLSYLAGEVSSMIVIGSSPWTVYTKANFEGRGICIYPDIEIDTSGSEVLSFSTIPRVQDSGIADNNIHSVKKGCHQN